MQALLQLSHRLGDPERRWAILGEGNASARLGTETFLVKASGSRLGSLTAAQVAEVRFAPLLAALETAPSKGEMSDSAVQALLASATHSPAGVVPSTETLMHAFLLTLPGVEFVGHTHVTSINGLLCSVRGWEFLVAGERLFPDEIVVCGPAPCCVPYADPGIPLARRVQQEVQGYHGRYGLFPRTIYLQNHGFVALGGSANEVEDIHQMADKSAQILAAALAIGEAHPLTPNNTARIFTWPAEHFRQKALGLTPAES